MSSYLVLFIFVYLLREMGSNTEMELVNQNGSSEDSDSCCRFILLCSLVKWPLSSVQVIGKFWSLHNPQKMRMCQISYKNYILDFPGDYLR